jgi:hypothetical protein
MVAAAPFEEVEYHTPEFEVLEEDFAESPSRISISSSRNRLESPRKQDADPSETDRFR